jgi:hypothetical protein
MDHNALRGSAVYLESERIGASGNLEDSWNHFRSVELSHSSIIGGSEVIIEGTSIRSSSIHIESGRLLSSKIFDDSEGQMKNFGLTESSLISESEVIIEVTSIRSSSVYSDSSRYESSYNFSDSEGQIESFGLNQSSIIRGSEVIITGTSMKCSSICSDSRGLALTLAGHSVISLHLEWLPPSSAFDQSPQVLGSNELHQSAPVSLSRRSVDSVSLKLSLICGHSQSFEQSMVSIPAQIHIISSSSSPSSSIFEPTGPFASDGLGKSALLIASSQIIRTFRFGSIALMSALSSFSLSSRFAESPQRSASQIRLMSGLLNESREHHGADSSLGPTAVYVGSHGLTASLPLRQSWTLLPSSALVASQLLNESSPSLGTDGFDASSPSSNFSRSAHGLLGESCRMQLSNVLIGAAPQLGSDGFDLTEGHSRPSAAFASSKAMALSSVFIGSPELHWQSIPVHASRRFSRAPSHLSDTELSRPRSSSLTTRFSISQGWTHFSPSKETEGLSLSKTATPLWPSGGTSWNSDMTPLLPFRSHPGGGSPTSRFGWSGFIASSTLGQSAAPAGSSGFIALGGAGQADTHVSLALMLLLIATGILFTLLLGYCVICAVLHSRRGESDGSLVEMAYETERDCAEDSVLEHGWLDESEFVTGEGDSITRSWSLFNNSEEEAVPDWP